MLKLPPERLPRDEKLIALVRDPVDGRVMFNVA